MVSKYRYKVSYSEYIGIRSERGPGQWLSLDKQNLLESWAKAGDSPVCVMRTIVLE